MSHLQCMDAQLFVHLTWGTRDARPLLGDDESRQAAYLAIMTRTRSQLCNVLAIDGTPCQVHMVVSFPASLPINALTRIAREAAQEAITRQQGVMGSGFQELSCYWAPDYTAHTLNAAEAAEAKTYLRQCLTSRFPVH